MLNNYKNIIVSALKKIVCISSVALVLIGFVSSYSNIANFQYLGQITGSINANAQTTSTPATTQTPAATSSSDAPAQEGLNVFGSVGFSECRIKEGSNTKPDGTALQSCIVQIVQFFFVTALFIVALRIVLESLKSINPFDKGKAVDNTIALIKDIIFGLLLLGSPAILLTLFNNTTLSINSILNLEAPKTKDAPAATNGTVTNNGGTNGGGTTNPGGGANNTSSGLNIKIGSKTVDIINPPADLTAAEKTQLKSRIDDVFDYLISGVRIDDIFVDINSNNTYLTIIDKFKTLPGLNESQKLSLQYLSIINSKSKDATVTKVGGKVFNLVSGDTFNIKPTSCDTNAPATCTYRADIINVNQSCDALIQNNKMSSNFPTLECFFIAEVG